MSNKLNVVVSDSVAGQLVKTESEVVFNYLSNTQSEQFVSLTMPVRDKSYVNT